MKKVEADAGVALFERDGRRGVKLTPAGTKLYAFVAPFFSELPTVMRSLADEETRGELQIATGGLVLRHLMPRWLRRFAAKQSEVTVHLRETSALSPRLLLDGSVDLLVDYFEELPANVSQTRVADAHAFIVVPAAHRAAARKTLRARDLRDTPFIAYSSELAHRALQRRALEAIDVAPRPVVTASSAESIVAMVAAGLGFSVVPWLSERGPSAAGIRALPFSKKSTTFPIAAVYRSNTVRMALIQSLLAHAPRL